MKSQCCCQYFFQLFNSVNDCVNWKKMYITFSSEGGCGDNHFGWGYNLGWNYMGRMSKTANGYDCQRSDSQTPHVHALNDPAKFADNSLDEASNYCRYYAEEIRSVGYIWCLTMEPNIVWEHCLCILPYAVSKVLWRLCWIDVTKKDKEKYSMFLCPFRPQILGGSYPT